MAVSVQLRSGALMKATKVAFFIAMYYVYIIYSAKCDRYYIGYSANVESRLQRHNRSEESGVGNYRTYKFCASKMINTELEERKEELRIKKQKSRLYIESIVAGNW